MDFAGQAVAAPEAEYEPYQRAERFSQHLNSYIVASFVNGRVLLRDGSLLAGVVAMLEYVKGLSLSTGPLSDRDAPPPAICRRKTTAPARVVFYGARAGVMLRKRGAGGG